MPDILSLFEQGPYSLPTTQKHKVLLDLLSELTHHHRQFCSPYYKMTTAHGHDSSELNSLSDLFQLPVQIFKHYELRSTENTNLIKTLMSSGTTSNQVSKVFIDKETTKLQTKALSAIMGNFLGPKRLPMIILDSASVIKDQKRFSARGGGIIGMSTFGRDHLYLFDENMSIRYEALDEFLAKYDGEKIVLFGFTFIIWHHLITVLEERGRTIDFKQAILIHSGGWKKLESEKVNTAEFKKRAKQVVGVDQVFNYYGMVEQMGSVYMECGNGHFHASIFSEILIRDPVSGKTLPHGEVGVIETLSVLPRSYPGHVILTEDQGLIHGVDDCSCGRKGTYFSVIGRLPKAEVRGCSDTYEATA